MPDHSGRIYAFDHLRTTMMFFILIFHAALTYIVTDLGVVWPFKDPSGTSLFFDVMISFITCAAMPMFFIMSGFMASMLFAEKGARQMIRNRISRISLPFVAFLLLLYPVTAIACLNLKAAIAGAESPFQTALTTFYKDQFEWREFKPMHLWFLYYLSLFCIATAGLIAVLRRTMPNALAKVRPAFEFLYTKKAAPLLFALLTFGLICARHQDIIETPGKFAINGFVMASYLLFFGFGWMLFHQRANLKRFKKRAMLYAIIGYAFFNLKMFVMGSKPLHGSPAEVYVIAALHALTVWFFMYGFIGLFLKYCNRYSKIGRYLTDASYWVYLIHFPIVFLLQGMLAPVDMSVYLKFLLVIGISFGVALVSYHHLVRFSNIGLFLNGKIQRRSKQPVLAPQFATIYRLNKLMTNNLYEMMSRLTFRLLPKKA